MGTVLTAIAENNKIIKNLLSGVELEMRIQS